MGVEVSKEGDVYSYGILLLEMFTERKPANSMFIENFSLHNYAKMVLLDRVMEIADSLFSLEEEDVSQRASQHNIGKIKECLVSVLRIGVICSSELSRERMDIRDISFVLLASNITFYTTFGFTDVTYKQALLAIENQILEDPTKVLGSWNDSAHFCKWQGVTCSRQHQRVTALNLSSLQLVGSLSPHIGNLTFLRVIHLENNSFRGTIPQEVGQLFRLQHLSLDTNSFQGEIPTEMGSLSNLLQLLLYSNHFAGKIPISFGNMSSLQELYLMSNNLEGSIPVELGQLSNLKTLQLSGNNLSGIVPTSLYNISSINYFAATENLLHGSLPPDFGLTLPNLQTFYFGNNQISGAIPPSLANASQLVKFDISYNAFTGPIPTNLGSLDDLQILSLVRIHSELIKLMT
ncbi:probable LRR receptor-like serine/threonine-protein kinase At3g47570 [Cornus florida]|uniref:probable LRR receptor-like serine/threonine-protein kinase At3g47570 n=1 Tax=Cornus florida TaxID=4283 RepID=UPI00289DDDFF|nr:probable LRR receptor-like serine/threonine-protein kinase At3g47570 [Cornus florida]